MTVATDERVTIDGARIEHAGEGILAEENGTRIFVRDSRLVALDPGTLEPVSQRAVTLFRPKSFVAAHPPAGARRLRRGRPGDLHLTRAARRPA